MTKSTKQEDKVIRIEISNLLELVNTPKPIKLN